MKTLALFMLGCLVCLFAFSAYAGEKVAVLDFKSLLAPEDLGVAVAEILRTELVGLDDYTVIERGMLAQVMQEQSLQLTGAVDSETAVEIGKIVGAKLVVTGSIVKTGSVYTINARFIDVETGIAKVGQNIRGQGEDQVSHMVHQLALIITGKTVATEEAIPGETTSPKPEPTTTVSISPQEGATMLFSFETQEEIRQWRHEFEQPSSLALAEEHVTDGTHALQMIISKSNNWQGIQTTNIPGDWSEYPIFAFDLYSKTTQPDSGWPLVVRIDDHETTRIRKNWFIRGYTVEPGAQTIRIYVDDVDKELDIKRIKQVILSTTRLEHEVEVYLDNMRFESMLPPAPIEPFSFSFEQRGEGVLNWHPNGKRIRIKHSDKHATQGEHSLQVDLPGKFPGNRYPGIFSQAFPRDWSNYRQFSADVYSDHQEKETFMIGVRIDDTASDSYETRFNWEMELVAGANEIRIPIENIKNSIDISRIQAVYFFLEEPQRKSTLYFDNIRLE